MTVATRADTAKTPRAALGKDAVLRAAVAIADARGIDALTMRGLARELGVEAMSLYHYVSNKSELLGGMVDLVMGEVESPLGSTDWVSDVRKSALSFHDALRRHPWASTVITVPASMSIARLRYMDALLRRLREAGFPPRLIDHAYHALDSHITGATLWEAAYRGWSSRVSVADVTQVAFRLMPADRHPDFHDHVRQHLTKRPPGEKTQFEFGLDLILDGLERLRGATASPSPRNTRRARRGADARLAVASGRPANGAAGSRRAAPRRRATRG